MSHKDGLQNNEDAKNTNQPLLILYNGGHLTLNKNAENLEPLFPESEITVGFL